jgi:hypothetical protein
MARRRRIRLHDSTFGKIAGLENFMPVLIPRSRASREERRWSRRWWRKPQSRGAVLGALVVLLLDRRERAVQVTTRVVGRPVDTQLVSARVLRHSEQMFAQTREVWGAGECRREVP